MTHTMELNILQRRKYIPFRNPFMTILNHLKTLVEDMRVNGLKHTGKEVLLCFEADGGT